MASDAVLSIRLPEATRRALDEAARKTRRSRAFVVKEALDRHLGRIEYEHSLAERRSAFERILALKGAGVGPEGGRSAEDIDAMIREIRGDD